MKARRCSFKKEGWTRRGNFVKSGFTVTQERKGLPKVQEEREKLNYCTNIFICLDYGKNIKSQWRLEPFKTSIPT